MSRQAVRAVGRGAGILGVGGWLVAALVSWAALAGTRPGGRDLEVRSLRLIDATGVARVEISTGDDGQARVVLRDAGGVDRLALRSHADGEAAVDLLDRGRLRASLEARPTGEAGLWLLDGSQSSRSALSATPEGVDLDLRGPSGSIHLGSTARAGQRIDLRDAAGQPIATLAPPAAPTPRPAPVLNAIRPPHGLPRAVVPLESGAAGPR
jgi:hypothetical protein